MSDSREVDLSRQHRRYDELRQLFREREVVAPKWRAGQLADDSAEVIRLRQTMATVSVAALRRERDELRRSLVRAGDADAIADEREEQKKDREYQRMLWRAPFTRDLLASEACDRIERMRAMRPHLVSVRRAVRSRPRERGRRRTARSSGGSPGRLGDDDDSHHHPELVILRAAA